MLFQSRKALFLLRAPQVIERLRENVAHKCLQKGWILENCHFKHVYLCAGYELVSCGDLIGFKRLVKRRRKEDDEKQKCGIQICFAY